MGDLITRLFVLGGDVAQALWHVIVAVALGIWAVLDWILNPILSLLLSLLNPLLTDVGDAVYAIFDPLPPVVGITVLSAFFGVVLLIAFKYLSNQKAIGRVRDTISASLLALKLYKDDMMVTLRTQGRLFVAIAKLQWYMFMPIIILLLPMLMAMAQMGVRYQWRPLRVGEETQITAELDDFVDEYSKLAIEPNEGLCVLAGPVIGGGEAVWRVLAEKAGRHTLTITCDGKSVTKEFVVGRAGQRVNPIRGQRWTDQLLNPNEAALPGRLPVRSISINYPPFESYIYGSDWWVLYFFVVSMVFALLFKPMFNVRM